MYTHQQRPPRAPWASNECRRFSLFKGFDKDKLKVNLKLSLTRMELARGKVVNGSQLVPTAFSLRCLSQRTATGACRKYVGLARYDARDVRVGAARACCNACVAGTA